MTGPPALRWGVLGTGKIAHALVDTMRVCPDVAVPVAVGSRTRESADRFCARRSGVEPVLGYDALVERADIDAVYVATPPHLHAEHVRMAIAAGKAVLCEKPFTSTVAEAVAVVAYAEQSGGFLMEAMWTRFVPAVARLRELLATGAIGEPQMFDAALGMVLDVSPDHYLRDPARGGGALLDVGPYPVSLATMIFGAPTSVTGIAATGRSGVDEQMSAQLGFPSGAIASFRLSFRTSITPTATVYGETGSITLCPPLFHPSGLVVQTDGGTQRIDFPDDDHGWRHQLAEVARCVDAGERESPTMPWSESVLCAQVLESIRTGGGAERPAQCDSGTSLSRLATSP